MAWRWVGLWVRQSRPALAGCCQGACCRGVWLAARTPGPACCPELAQANVDAKRAYAFPMRRFAYNPHASLALQYAVQRNCPPVPLQLPLVRLPAPRLPAPQLHAPMIAGVAGTYGRCMPARRRCIPRSAMFRN